MLPEGDFLRGRASRQTPGLRTCRSVRSWRTLRLSPRTSGNNCDRHTLRCVAHFYTRYFAMFFDVEDSNIVAVGIADDPKFSARSEHYPVRTIARSHVPGEFLR